MQVHYILTTKQYLHLGQITGIQFLTEVMSFTSCWAYFYIPVQAFWDIFMLCIEGVCFPSVYHSFPSVFISIHFNIWNKVTNEWRIRVCHYFLILAIFCKLNNFDLDLLYALIFLFPVFKLTLNKTFAMIQIM